ncbi:hypothetical protein FA95DRAFT_1500217, partial [Auriscalpium vulgare]
TRRPDKSRICARRGWLRAITLAPFGDAYEKIGTIQRRLAWPLHKDDTLFQSGRSTDLNIYFVWSLALHRFSTCRICSVTISYGDLS